MGIKWLLVLVVATSLLATGAAYSASPAAEDAIRNLPSDLPPQARVDRLDAAISTEKRQKTPDAYFLLWTLSRKAELLGNKSDPLAVCKEGLGRPTEAVATAQE